MRSLPEVKLGRRLDSRSHCCRRVVSAHPVGGDASHICYCFVSPCGNRKDGLRDGPGRHGNVFESSGSGGKGIKVGGQVARLQGLEVTWLGC